MNWGSDRSLFNRIWDDPDTDYPFHSSGQHNPTTYLGWGTTPIANDTEAVPSYINGLLTSGLIEGEYWWGWSMSGGLWIPNNGAAKWYFAINSCGGYLRITGNTPASGTPNQYFIDDLTSAAPRDADENEFADNNWATGGIAIANLKVGNQNGFIARVAIDTSRAAAGVYGIAFAWRDDGQVIDGSGITSTKKPTITTASWNGNTCYEVEVVYEAGTPPTTFKWRWREQLTIGDTDTFDSWSSYTTGVTIGAYVIIADGETLGTIGFSGATAVATDTFTFKFGWLPLKKEHMQRRSSTSSSTTNLNPKHLAFYEGRLWLCGFDVEPFRIIGSRSGQLEDFSISSRSLDTDAVDITIMKDQSNPIVGATSNAQGLIILTANGIAVVNGGNDAITPSKTQVKFHSSLRAAEVRPISVDNAILFVEAGKKNIQKILYDSIGESFAPDNVTLLCDHLTINRIFEMVFTPSFITKGTIVTTAPAIKVLWFIEGTSTDVNRKLRSITLEDAHKVRAAAKHTVCSDSEVLSICALPSSTGGDDLYALIRSTAKSKNIITKYDPTTYADTLSATGSTLNYTQRIETLPPEIELPFGTSRAFKKRWVDAHLTLKNTSNLTVLPLWIYDTVSLAQSVGVSGTVEDANYKILGWDKNAQLRIQQTTGASMEVLALHGKLAVSIK